VRNGARIGAQRVGEGGVLQQSTGMQRHLGVAVLLAGALLQTPLVTPGTTIDDPLLQATPAPVVTESAAPSTIPVSTSAVTATAPPEASTSDAPAPDQGFLTGLDVAGFDIVLAAVAALATGLALVGLRERVRVPGPLLLGSDPRERPFPAPAQSLFLAHGTEAGPELLQHAAEYRFALRVDILVLPVLARPTHQGPSWIEWHDAADSWLWHESWLRASQGTLRAVEPDGLLLGDEAPVGPESAGGVWAVPPASSIAVLGVSEGVILSRPAAGSLGELRERWARRVMIWRAEAGGRPAAGVLVLHGLTHFPLALALPVAALLAAVPGEVLAVALGPLAVGFVSAALRWAALDDLDRATTVRFPAALGALLVITGPLHAVSVWLGTVSGLVGARPLRLSSGRRTDEAAA